MFKPEPTSVGLHVDFTPTEETAIGELEEVSSKDGNNNKRRKNEGMDGMYNIDLGDQSSSKETLEHQPMDHGEQAITIWKAILIPVSDLHSFQSFQYVISLYFLCFLRVSLSSRCVSSLPN